MAEKMMQFVTIGQNYPDKRTAEERKQDFNEIYARFTIEKAQEQASRCEQCGIPYCSVACPVSNNIPDWLRLVAAGRLEDAYHVSQETNSLPEICGRICPQDRLCEGLCVLEQSEHDAVTIGSIEKFITDNAFEQGWVKGPQPLRELGQSVGIIGAGPAGIAAADRLRRKGYEVHVYDRHDRVGGLLVYGIPGFKLEKDVVARRHKLLEEGGVQFHLNFEIGRDASLKDLREKHDAVMICVGVYAGRKLDVPGSDLENIFPAMYFLTASNRKSFGDKVEEFDDGTLNAEGKNVVVIGGGDTAMDCVRTSIRQGAKSVKCLYRRDRTNMPGSQNEVRNAEGEGVDFEWLSAPKSFKGLGKVQKVEAVSMHLGVADGSGRQSVKEIEGSEFELDADMVIEALGFEPEDVPTLFGEPDLAVTRWGTLDVNKKTWMTSIDGVFAAGDIERGASLVVNCINDAREASDQVHKYLRAQARAGVAAE
ncbi:NAD(P)-dependent oxidoreductase [Terasakiella pusilla]|uniref:NAD(P)-dependent oxidoreductase n=1 Tax=Terasakiella pusilla TaxID=64973 RepID=UPI00048C3AB4|nr:NAD(P)-dependent oxidoreductase [Terasakiella pusilla]